MRRALATAGKAAVLTAFLVKVSSACVDLDSLGNGVPIVDGAPEATTGETSTFPDLCQRAVPPGPPQNDDDPATELPPFVVAIDEAILDKDRVAGFDLDGLCTCDDRAGAAADGGPGCAPPGEVMCDLGGGADNATAVIAATSVPGESIDRLPNRTIRSGQRTLLLQLIKYNGRANDTDVSVGAFPAEGIRTQGCPESTLDTNTQTYTPGLCGSDVWSVGEIGAVSTTPPRPVVVGSGFVSDYRLIARFTGDPPALPFAKDAAIRVQNAVVSAKIVPLDDTLQPRDGGAPPLPSEQRLYRLDDGVLAGRAALPDVLLAVGSYRPGGLGPLCADSANFPTIRDRLCEGADIRMDSLVSSVERCDGLSFAMGFKAFPVLLGPRVPSPPPPPECTDVSLLTCPPQ